MSMKYTSIIVLQMLAITWSTFAGLPLAQEEPPITSKEQLIERLTARQSAPTSSDEIRDRVRELVEAHPEIMPLIPFLRDHPSGRVREQVLMIEIMQSPNRDDVVRKALRSDDPWRRGEAKRYIGPLLGEPEFAHPWLKSAQESFREWGEFKWAFDVLQDAPVEAQERLEHALVSGLLTDLREGQVAAIAMSSVLKFLRERPEIEREALLEAIIAADVGFDERFEAERHRYATPDLFYLRARNSLLVNRVYLGDETALDTILTGATTKGGEERQRHIFLLQHIEPTVRILHSVLELLGDSEQVGELGPIPSHTPPGWRPPAMLARDAGAFLLRHWFDNAPGATPGYYTRRVSDAEVAELTVWLSLKIADLRLQEEGLGDGPPPDGEDDDDRGTP